MARILSDLEDELHNLSYSMYGTLLYCRNQSNANLFQFDGRYGNKTHSIIYYLNINENSFQLDMRIPALIVSVSIVLTLFVEMPFCNIKKLLMDDKETFYSIFKYFEYIFSNIFEGAKKTVAPKKIE
jgi:hypothetical protein